jgi:hypothetical protein
MTFSKLSKLVAVSIMVLLVLSGCSGAAITTGTAKPAGQPGGPTGTPPTQAASTPLTIKSNPAGNNIKLPDPVVKSTVSLEETLQARRSIRSYADASLSLSNVSQLMWAAQGITSSSGQRTAPSAMRAYAIDVYVVVNNVEGLDKGIYLYVPAGNCARPGYCNCSGLR